MNNVSLVGRITQDPELRRTGEAIPVVTYSLAVNRPKVKDTVDFINCVTWRQAAEFLATYAHKGDRIAVTGALQSREWTDKDGVKHKTWEVVTDTVELLSAKKSENTSSPAQAQNVRQGAYGGAQGYNGTPYNPQSKTSRHQQQQFESLTDYDGELPF